MATYYTKQKGITYRDYTGSGDALDQEAWYAAQDANYLSTANNALKNAKFTASYDVFNKFVTDYAQPGTAYYPNSLINSVYNKIKSGQSVSDAEKAQVYYAWDAQVSEANRGYQYVQRLFQKHPGLRNDVSYLGEWEQTSYAFYNWNHGKTSSDITGPLWEGYNKEFNTWKNQQGFYEKVLNAKTSLDTIKLNEENEAKRLAEAEKKRQQTIQAETEAKTAARKNGHQIQTEVFKDAAELMYGSKATEEETTGSGITPGVAASGLTLSGTNTTGGKLSGTTATTDNPVSRREKARRGLLGGVA